MYFLPQVFSKTHKKNDKNNNNNKKFVFYSRQIYVHSYRHCPPYFQFFIVFFSIVSLFRNHPCPSSISYLILIVLMVFLLRYRDTILFLSLFFSFILKTYSPYWFCAHCFSISLIMEVVINVPLPFFEKDRIFIFFLKRLSQHFNWRRIGSPLCREEFDYVLGRRRILSFMLAVEYLVTDHVFRYENI